MQPGGAWVTIAYYIHNHKRGETMSTENKAQDPLEFMRSMWSKMGFNLPGMVTPTLDVDELDKRIADMKAVENWLKMNLSSLQMATQGLEMQRATISAMQAMSKVAAEGGNPEIPQAANPFTNGMWPWNLIQGTTPQPQPAPAAPAPAAPAAAPASKSRAAK